MDGGAGSVVRVTPGGGVDKVTEEGLKFPNGMALIDRDHTLIAAAEWRGMDTLAKDGPGQTGQLLAARGQPAAHAGRP